jgi:TldD protein
VRMSNTFILPGTIDPDSIVREAGSGLFVADMGGGQVNTVTGDFVFEVTEGYAIEKGKIGRLVRGATIIGNSKAVLKGIAMVGSDIGFKMGTCGKNGQAAPVTDGQPTILVTKGLVVGSKG